MRALEKNIRRLNLLNLFYASKLNNKQFAAKIGVMPAYFTQVKKGKERGGRDIGNKIATRIEDAFDLPHGWMSKFHDIKIDNKISKHLDQEFIRLTYKARELPEGDLSQIVESARKILKS